MKAADPKLINCTTPSKARSRRTFFSRLGLAAAGLAVTPHVVRTAEPEAQTARPARKVKLGISTYSYWHFRPPKVSIETVIEKASELGVEGVDILPSRSCWGSST